MDNKNKDLVYSHDVFRNYIAWQVICINDRRTILAKLTFDGYWGDEISPCVIISNGLVLSNSKDKRAGHYNAGEMEIK